jgi:hypothetical protein
VRPDDKNLTSGRTSLSGARRFADLAQAPAENCRHDEILAAAMANTAEAQAAAMANTAEAQAAAAHGAHSGTSTSTNRREVTGASTWQMLGWSGCTAWHRQ